MNNSSKDTSTGSSYLTSDNKNYSKIVSFIYLWWAVILLLIVLVLAGITKYIYPNPILYSLMIDLVKATSIIMIVMYVIYTRILSLETKRMAQASMGLYISEKGTVLTEVNESICTYEQLPENCQKSAKDIHTKEKKMSEKEFEDLVYGKNAPAIFLKIKNMSGRRIEASKIMYQIRSTGSDNFYDITCDISKTGTINPWADKEIPLVVAPEGEIEIKINFMEYLDGGVVQRIQVSQNKILERIRKPAKNIND
jgi:hypothetical protein